MHQQNIEHEKEALAKKTSSFNIDKVDQFDQWNVSKYIWIYAREIELNKILENKIIESFELDMIFEIYEHMKELKKINKENWKVLM